jgi:hypothetical protein
MPVRDAAYDRIQAAYLRILLQQADSIKTSRDFADLIKGFFDDEISAFGIPGVIVSGDTSTVPQDIGLLPSGILIGSVTAGINTIGTLTIGSGLSLIGTTLSVTGGGGGSVTAVTGSTPIISSGGTAPNISIQGAYVSGDSSTTAQDLGLLTTGILFGTVTGGVNTVSTLTVGSGLNLTGSTLVATGSGGSVTVVTGTSPIVITSVASATPNVTIQGGIVSGSTSSSPQNLGSLTTGLLLGTVSGGVNTLSTLIIGSGLTLTGSTLTSTGSGISQLTTDVTAGPGSGSQVATIAAHAVTYNKFQQDTGPGVLGVQTSTTTNYGMIQASASGVMLTALSGVVTWQFPGGDLSGTYPSPTVNFALLANGIGTQLLGINFAGTVEVLPPTPSLSFKWSINTPGPGGSVAGIVPGVGGIVVPGDTGNLMTNSGNIQGGLTGISGLPAAVVANIGTSGAVPLWNVSSAFSGGTFSVDIWYIVATGTGSYTMRFDLWATTNAQSAGAYTSLASISQTTTAGTGQILNLTQGMGAIAADSKIFVSLCRTDTNSGIVLTPIFFAAEAEFHN